MVSLPGEGNDTILRCESDHIRPVHSPCAIADEDAFASQAAMRESMPLSVKVTLANSPGASWPEPPPWTQFLVEGGLVASGCRASTI